MERTYHVLFRLLVCVVGLCVGIIDTYWHGSTSSSSSIPLPAWGQSEYIYQSPNATFLLPEITEDRDKNLHTVWEYRASNEHGLLYSYRTVGQQWSFPEKVPLVEAGILDRFQTVTNSNSILHLLYTTLYPNKLYSLFKNKDGTWSNSTVLADSSGRINVQLGVGGTNYLLTHSDYYWYLLPDSTKWISDTTPFPLLNLQSDNRGSLHGLFVKSILLPEVTYAKQSDDNSWQELATLSAPLGARVDFALDGSNNAHFLWNESTSYPCFPVTCYREWLVYSAYISNTLITSSTVPGSDLGTIDYELYLPDLAVSQHDTVSILWNDRVLDQNGIFHPRVGYIEKNPFTGWGDSLFIDGNQGSMLVNIDDTVHVFWYSDSNEAKYLHQWRRSSSTWMSDGHPNQPISAPYSTYNVVEGGAIFDQNQIHFVYAKGKDVVYNKFSQLFGYTPTSTATLDSTPTQTINPEPSPPIVSTAIASPSKNATPIHSEISVIYLPIVIQAFQSELK